MRSLRHGTAILLGLTLAATAIPTASSADGAETETIVFVRHGEKPAQGLGQLSCKGLNRALALPPVVARLAGTPAAVFAPNPADRKKDNGVSFSYVRPLATIEPTAIALGLPVDTRFGVSSVPRLRAALLQPSFHNASVVVAWEHRQIVTLVQGLLSASGGDGSVVPPWAYDDYDSAYIVTIHRLGTKASATFTREHEGLDGLPDACPR